MHQTLTQNGIYGIMILTNNTSWPTVWRDCVIKTDKASAQARAGVLCAFCMRGGIVMKNTCTSRRVVLILLLVSLLCACMTGCRIPQKYEWGSFGWTNHPECIMMGVTADTDTFAADSVELNLHFGLFPAEDASPRGAYSLSGTDSEVFFAIYVVNYAGRHTISTGQEYENYKTIDNHHFIKEISEDDAFSSQYSYIMRFIGGITYQHQEPLHIPENVFEEGIFHENRGSFQIVIAAWQQSTETQLYCLKLSNTLEIDYLISEDGYVDFLS